MTKIFGLLGICAALLTACAQTTATPPADGNRPVAIDEECPRTDGLPCR